MKRFITAATLLCSLCALTRAEDTLNYELQIVKHSAGAVQSLERMSMTARLGHPVPFSRVDTWTYVEDVTPHAAGLVISPATVTTGFSGMVRPISTDAATGAVATDFGVALTKVEGMETKMVGGHEIKKPVVKSVLPESAAVDAELRGGRTFSMTRGAAPTLIAQGTDGTQVYASLK